MVSIYGGSGGGGFDYVQDPSPQDPNEGEEWYDTGSNAAYVYDGASWIEETIADHGELSGVGANDHHTRPSNTESASESHSWSGSYSSGTREIGGATTFTIGVNNGIYDAVSVNLWVEYGDPGSIDWIRVNYSDGSSFKIRPATDNKEVEYAHAMGEVDTYDVRASNDDSHTRGVKIDKLSPHKPALSPHSHSL